MTTKHSEGIPNTLIIENPFTGKYVNILPLLQFSFKELSGFNSGENSVLKVLDDTIRTITCHVDYDVFGDEYQGIVFQLYGLRDAMLASSELVKMEARHGK